MKSMHKSKLNQTILLIPFITLLSACGGGESSNKTTENTGSGQKPVETIARGYAVSDVEADRRAQSMLGLLSFQQKIDLVHGHGSPVGQLGYIGLNYPQVPGAMDKAVGFIPGIPSLGLPDNNMVDGSSGVTAEHFQATALPATVGLAATWSTDIAYQYGKRIGAEARLLGFTTVLGGGINLIRDPRSGRGFEFMGEDPILAGELAAERTIGVQENKLQSTIKHFAFNSIETNRMVSNSIIDEQTMRETELLAFEIAITKGKPSYVMCAFNQVNGDYACENDYLLNQVLKKEWGFKGMVMSDWGAQSSTVKAALNGLDEEQPGQHVQDTEIPQFMALYMGGPWFIDALAQAVQSNQVPLSRLDDMVYRKLRSMIAVGLVDAPPKQPSSVNESAGNADAKRFADATMVLLKNNAPANLPDANKVLPLDKTAIQTLVVVGGDADKGVLSGGGSGGAAPLIENQVDKCGQLPISPYPTCPTYIGVAPLTALQQEYPNATISYFDGNDANAAAIAAESADATIIFAAAWFNEGLDNKDMKLSSPANDSSGVFTYDQDQLISTVAAKAKRSIVVLQTGQAVLMPWVDQVDAILNAWYPGVQGAYSIADVLSGDLNPSGKLPISFPKSEQDLVMTSLPVNLGDFLGTGAMIKSLENTVRSIVNGIMGEGAYDAIRQIPYAEQLAWNGYKWLDKNSIEPLFAFGHGLSYSSFIYSQPSATTLANGNIQVTFQIDNASNKTGIEIAQVYVSLPETVPGNVQPPKRLAGWARVELQPQQVKTISVEIPRKYISTWDINKDQWIVTAGNYSFTVADSAALDTTANALTTELNIQ